MSRQGLPEEESLPSPAPDGPIPRDGQPDSLGEAPTETGAAASSHAAPVGADDPRVWPHLSGYEIIGLVGRGGTGTVYKARQRSLNRLVALKMLVAEAPGATRLLIRFQHEAEASVGFHHPNIAAVYDVGRYGAQPYFTSELVEGGSLAERIDAKPQPALASAAMVEKLARAVHFAHQHGIVHRDLKPANVLLTPSGEPKITDFGIARRIEVDSPSTGCGPLEGTPSYMAPEQARGAMGEVGPAVDVYALGTILYEMLTGRPPFLGETSEDTVMQVLSGSPVLPRRLRPNVPRELERICLKCLDRSPGRRYASAEVLADDLRRYLEGRAIHARPLGAAVWAWRRCRRSPLAAALLATLIAGFAAVAWQWRRAEDNAAQAVHERGLAESRLDDVERQKQQIELQKIAAGQQRDQARRREAARSLSLYVARINLAWKAWQQGDIRRMRALLSHYLSGSGGKDPLCGFEWEYLWGLCHSEGRVTLRGHSGPVRSVAYTADGKSIVTAGQDGNVIFWDAATGDQGQVLRAGAPAGPLAVSADGRWLAVAVDGQPKLVDLRERRHFLNLPGFWTETLSLAFSPNSNWLAAVAAGGSGLTWSLKDGREGEFTVPLGAWRRTSFLPLAFSPDGRCLTAAPSGLISIDGTEAVVAPAVSAAFSPDGDTVALGLRSREGRVLLWDPNTGRTKSELRGHRDWVTALAFSPDGTLLATAGRDTTARLWEMPGGRLLATLKGHAGPVHSLAFSADGRELATASEDGTATVWQLGKVQEAEILQSEGWCVDELAFTCDSRALLCLGCDTFVPDSVLRWNVLTGTLEAVFPRRNKPVGVLAFSPDGKTLVAGAAPVGRLGAPGDFRLIDAASGKTLAELQGVEGHVASAAFSPDGRLLATGTYGREPRDLGEVKVWDATTGKHLRTLGTLSGGPLVVFAPDGTLWAGSSSRRGLEKQGDLRRWNPETGNQLARFRDGLGHLNTLAISPDGKIMATGHGLPSSARSGKVKLWDMRGSEPLATLVGHKAAVTSVAFSHDGKLLASGDADGRVRLWRLKDNSLLRATEPARTDVLHLAFTPDDATLVAVALLMRRQAKPESKPENEDGGEKGDDAAGPPRLLLLDGLGFAISPDGDRVALSSLLRELGVWDRDGAALAAEPRWKSEKDPDNALPAPRLLAVSADGKHFVTVGSDHAIRLRDVATNASVETVGTTSAKATHLATSPVDGSIIALAMVDSFWEPTMGHLSVWDLRQRKRRFLEPLDGRPTAIVFSPDGKLLAACTKPFEDPKETKISRILLLDVADGQVLPGSQEFEFPPLCVDFAPGGRVLAVGRGDGKVTVLDLDGAQRRTFAAHDGEVLAIAFSRDGKTLVTGGSDETVRLWNTATWEELIALEHTGVIQALRFSPDGTVLATGAANLDSLVAISAANLDLSQVRLYRATEPSHP